MQKEVNNEAEMRDLGCKIGNFLHGGETIELIGDIGVGKTTFTKGLALGLGVKETVQSPSFTISRIYDGRDDLSLHHYDFYRLNNAGVMSNELEESVNDPKAITVVEWGEIVGGVLPQDRLTIAIIASDENYRKLSIQADGKIGAQLMEVI